MKINLLAIGTKMPTWISQGYQEYAKRLPKNCSLNLIEIATEKRRKNSDLERFLQRQGQPMIQAIPKNNLVIALDLSGQNWNTIELSQQLTTWLAGGQDISLLIGGAEGLAPSCLTIASLRWSLSALTFPHPLVRIIVAEQIYRAFTLLNQHPYHK